MAVSTVCPKCGGNMVEGKLKYWFKRTIKQPITPGMVERNVLNDLVDLGSTTAHNVHWEEKTGEKKGFIFKREEISELQVTGYRCTACNYLELFAITE